LAAGLFDTIPLEAMAAAESALRLATARLAADVVERFTSAAHLSPEDRAATLAVATQALLPFQPAPAAKPEPAAVKSDAAPASKPGPSAAA
jgi:hypothetical protein